MVAAGGKQRCLTSASFYTGSVAPAAMNLQYLRSGKYGFPQGNCRGRTGEAGLTHRVRPEG